MNAPTFLLDGTPVPFEPGETIIEAATRAGAWVPHLCWHPDFAPHGSCRLCTVEVGGRMVAACTAHAAEGQVVACRTPALDGYRRQLLQFLFVQGNHFCPGCEVSGACELQAAAYAMAMDAPHFAAVPTHRAIDASHPDILLDLERCILCELCVRASRDVDGKDVFAIAGHGLDAHLIVNSASGRLGDSTLSAADRAAHVCPVGAILPKRRGFAVPIGARRFDLAPRPDATVVVDATPADGAASSEGA
jgi:[NiFe] hydrogenase diaphorase moiety small subunit